MKALNLTLRTILLTLFLVSTTTSFAYDFVVKGIYYNINGDEATVTYQKTQYFYNYGNSYYEYCNDNTGTVTIPETVTFNGKNYTVTSIGDHAFCHYNSESITAISLPNTINSIGEYAFYDCYGLTEITIPESVISIGNLAFYNCRGLKNINI